MEIGKVPESVLKRTILKQLTVKRDEVLFGPSIGEDCAVLQFGPDELLVLSTDPITGTTKELGKLAIHITANDIASSGAELVGVLLTILLPPGYTEEGLKTIMADINEVCFALNTQVLGGHTEVTSAVNQALVSVTGVGKTTKERLALSAALKPGDDLVMTKWAGVEGTAILAMEKEEVLLSTVKPNLIEEAKAYTKYLSVVPESKIAVSQGATAMHDITEGGVYGALWEMASGSSVGFEVNIDAIPITRATIEITEFFGINPYQLISSGAMLIGTKDGQALVEALKAEGIHAALIGKVTAGNERLILGKDIRRTLKPPKSDELYKVL